MTSSLKRCERVESNILLAIVKTASDREAALEMHGVRNSENRMPPCGRSPQRGIYFCKAVRHVWPQERGQNRLQRPAHESSAKVAGYDYFRLRPRAVLVYG